MGLLTLALLANEARTSIKRPELTPFGRAVLLEDPYLKEAITQWIAHFKSLAVQLRVQTFGIRSSLSPPQHSVWTFEREKLEHHLSLVYQNQRTGLIGPLVGMYEDEAAFALCGALSEQNGKHSTHGSAD